MGVEKIDDAISTNYAEAHDDEYRRDNPNALIIITFLFIQTM